MLIFGWNLDLGHFIQFNMIFPNSFSVQGERNKTFNAWYFIFNIKWLYFCFAEIVFMYIQDKGTFWMKTFNASQVWKTITCLNVRIFWISETCFIRKKMKIWITRDQRICSIWVSFRIIWVRITWVSLLIAYHAYCFGGS